MEQTKRTPIEPNSLIFGDSLEVLRGFPDNTFTAVVTDPPYGLSSPPDMKEVLKQWMKGKEYEHGTSGFMGKDWDSFVPGPAMWTEIMRVLKPGGHILSFSGTRTYDLMALAMRIAGAEVRDKLDYYCEMTGYHSWMYGSGFPKSHDISKAIDKAQGAERETIRVPADEIRNPKSIDSGHGVDGGDRPWMKEAMEKGYHEKPGDEPASEEGKKWEGYGTALKPAHEPIADFTKGEGQTLKADAPFSYIPKVGKRERNRGCTNLFWKTTDDETVPIEKAEYAVLKAENEKRKGEEGFTPHRVSQGNIWPTVKPIELMRYLVKMVKMPGDNLILEPFMGSGTTPIACVLEGIPFVGIDRDPVAFKIASARVRYFKLLGRHAIRK